AGPADQALQAARQGQPDPVQPLARRALRVLEPRTDPALFRDRVRGRHLCSRAHSARARYRRRLRPAQDQRREEEPRRAGPAGGGEASDARLNALPQDRSGSSRAADYNKPFIRGWGTLNKIVPLMRQRNHGKAERCVSPSSPPPLPSGWPFPPHRPPPIPRAGPRPTVITRFPTAGATAFATTAAAATPSRAG